MIKKLRNLLLILPIIFMFLLFSGFTENQKVFDNANLLSDEEIVELQEKCIETAKENKIDILIITLNDSSLSTSHKLRVYAADFYEENDYGYEGPVGTGIILTINMATRDVYIVTADKAIGYYTDEDIQNMLATFQTDLSSANYYEAFDTFIDDVPLFIEEGTYNIHKCRNLVIAIIIALIISIIITVKFILGAGGKVTTNSRTYLNANGTKIINKQDIYTHTTRSTRVIPKSNGGGGSSTFSSSSGGSFGGGGGKF